MKKLFTLFVAALCSAAMMADVVYSVAGSPASLFGAEWDEKSTATEMTLEGNTYIWRAENVYLPAGKVEYKVILNHDWATSWPVQGNSYSNELTEGMYNVTIEFHPDVHSMGLIPERIGDAPVQETNYYLVGTITTWNVVADEAHTFQTTEVAGEYKLHYTLAEGDGIKVVGVTGQNKTWYPEGEGTEYKVDAAHAGECDIYFRPAGNPDWSAFGGFFYVAMSEVQPPVSGDQLEIRLIPGVWDLDGAKFAAIAINYIPEGEPNIGAIMQTASCSDWFTLAADGNGYIGYIPADTKIVAFGRMSPSTPAPTIENIMSPDGYLWNHSDLLTLDPSMKYTIDGWAAEGKDYCPGHWGDQVAPEQGSDYYVVGSMTGWAVDANYRMSANPNADGEYMITAHLLPTDMFKAAKSEDGKNIITWYPDGMENSYGEHGEIAEEGDYTIYFRPAGNMEGWHSGFIYVQKDGQGIDQILSSGKAAKVFRNGQFLILKGDKTYNILGGAAE